jgi:site-specific DNA recombinase
MYVCHTLTMTSPAKYFIYCRKSSEDEDRQILSIDAQITELKAIALREGLSIVGTFTESKSAREPGREIFNDVVRRIEKGEANALLSWKLDRLARNFDDGGRIIGLLQRGVITSIRTFERTYLPADNVLMIAMELGMANQYVRDLSVNIQRGIREKVRRGVWHGLAPLGYYNHPKLRTVEPDPESFPKVKRILEQFATGRYSLTAIQKEMASAGILGRLSHKPLPLSSIGNAFRNHFYYGVFFHKGEMHQGTHVPMISKRTFDDIQKALVTVGKPRKHKHREEFLFLNFATCASCGHCITAERHVKKSGLRFNYYRCTHKNKKLHCQDRGFVRDNLFAEEVKRNTALVALPDDWKERFLVQLERWEAEATQTSQGHLERLRAELEILKAKIDRINTAFTEGTLEIQEFKELKNPLVVHKVELEQEIQRVNQRSTSRLEPLRNWIIEANQAEKWVFDENWLEMKSFLQKVGSNRFLRAQTLTVSFKKPWNFLAETTVAIRRVSDAAERNSKWWCLLNEARTFFDGNPV